MFPFMPNLHIKITELQMLLLEAYTSTFEVFLLATVSFLQERWCSRKRSAWVMFCLCDQKLIIHSGTVS